MRHLLIGMLTGVTLLSGCSAPPPGLQLGGTREFNSKALKAFKPNLPRGEKERKAVLLSFLPVDDPLEDHIPVYLSALEKTTSDKIYNLAFSDSRGPDNSFFHLLGREKGKAFLSPTQKELTSNDPAVLSGTVAWAYSKYPASFKALSFLGHGGGFMGISSDLTPGNDDYSRVGQMMGIQEFASGLRLGLKGRKLNLIHLHACLMANVEAAYELRDLSGVLFASEDSIGENTRGTMKSAETLNALLQKSDDARWIAKESVIELNPKREAFGYSTASAIDLDRIAEVKQAMNELSRALIAGLKNNREAIAAACESVPEFRDYPESGQRDLLTLCNRLNHGVKDLNIQNAALNVKACLRKAILHNQDSQGEASNGLSIFLPKQGDAGAIARANGEGYSKTRFAHDTLWDEFLQALAK